MGKTKTGKRQRIDLPEEAMEVLADHVGFLEDPPLSLRWRRPPMWWRPAMAESILLFPAKHGGYRARSVLDKPFRDVSKRMGLPFTFTPRGLRRTFQDLARAASVPSLVKRAISGHATETMEELYSTVAPSEVLTGLERVFAITNPVERKAVTKAVTEENEK